MTSQAAQAKQPTLLGRSARMLLVFLLVFGMSFRVEMALAADLPTSGASDLKSHAEGDLVDLAVCKVDADKKVVDIEDGVVRSLATELKYKEDKKTDSVTGLTLAYGESVTLAAAPQWKGAEKPDAAAAEYIEWKVGDEESSKPTVTIDNDGTLGKKVTVTCTVSKDYKELNAQDYLAEKYLEAKVTAITFDIELGEKSEPVATSAISAPTCVLKG